MADGRVWTKSTTKLLVGIIGEAVKPKVPFLVRGLINPAIKIALKTSNTYLDRVIPDEIDGFVNDAIIKGYEGDWDNAAIDIGLAGDMLVDIPNLDDEHEKKLFVTIAQAIVQSVKTWIENKKNK